jgi:hypothetical protein
MSLLIRTKTFAAAALCTLVVATCGADAALASSAPPGGARGGAPAGWNQIHRAVRAGADEHAVSAALGAVPS